MKLSNVLLHLDTFNSIVNKKIPVLFTDNIRQTLEIILADIEENPNLIFLDSWDYSSDIKEILFSTFTNLSISDSVTILDKLVVEN